MASFRPITYLCYFYDLWNIQISSDRWHTLTDEVRFISFLSVHHIGILFRVNGDRPYPSFSSCSKNSDGYFTTICDQQFLDPAPPWLGFLALVELISCMDVTACGPYSTAYSKLLLNNFLEAWSMNS